MVCVVSNLVVKQCMPFIAGRLPLILRQCDHALQQQNCCYNIVVLHLHLTEALTDCRVVLVSMLNICRVPISWNCKFKKILFFITMSMTSFRCCILHMRKLIFYNLLSRSGKWQILSLSLINPNKSGDTVPFKLYKRCFLRRHN